MNGPNQNFSNNKTSSGCLVLFVAISSGALFFVAIALALIGTALSGLSGASSSAGETIGIVTAFSSYFGLIFISCFRRVSGTPLRIFGIIITLLDLFWTVFLIVAISRSHPDNIVIALLLLIAFPSMNILWFLAVRNKFQVTKTLS